MADTKKSFLERKAYQPGEFERQQRLWDDTVEKLTHHLIIQVGNTVRKQTVDEARKLAALTQATLDVLLNYPAPPEVGGPAVAAMAAELYKPFVSAESPNDAAVEAEVRSTCRELSQRVLTKWFDLLARARRAGEAVPLNAVMLPGGTSVAQMLSGLNLETYEATLPDVDAALSWYQRDLVEEFERTREPITFGARLLVVPVSGDPRLPFQLFAEEAAAKKAATSQPEREPEGVQQCLSEVIRVTQVIPEVVTSRMPELDPAFGRAMKTVSFPDLPAALTCATTLDADQLSFGSLVNLGLDAVCSGLAVSVNTAEQNLKEQLGLITDALNEQAKEIRVNSSAMRKVYVFTLRTACGVKIARPRPIHDPAVTYLTVQQQFENAFNTVRGWCERELNVSQQDAKTLAETSITGLRLNF
jgi:hypothetical protein